MVTNTPGRSRSTRRLPPPPPRGRLDRRYFGISGRYWVITGIVLGLCLSLYEVSNSVSPNAFDQPGAQIPNQLRSPWGVKNPL
jgi:hypothetical protein